MAAPPLALHYSAGEVADDPRYQYYWDLIQAALDSNEAGQGKIKLVPYAGQMNGERALHEILSDGRIDIMVRTTSRQLESVLTPVRIPLDKGLTGYRLLLVRRDREASLARVSRLAELRRFSLGQQDGWVDVEILRHAGLTVTTANHYEGLFSMLQLGRFDALPRGVNEIANEYRLYRPRYPDMVIDKTLVLYYPMARYVFVAPGARGQALARRIEDGLRRLIANGEFERRYQRYRSQVLDGVSLPGRHLIRLDNPYLPERTPLGDASLWDAPVRLESAPR